jgi:hypothetical protein
MHVALVGGHSPERVHGARTVTPTLYKFAREGPLLVRLNCTTPPDTEYTGVAGGVTDKDAGSAVVTAKSIVHGVFWLL